MSDVHYLEIVTTDVEGVCQTYAGAKGLAFSTPVPELGGARVAERPDKGMIGVRPPLRDSENPVVRPYVLVDDIAAAVREASNSGAEVALPAMPLGTYGTCAIVIHGGIEMGFWQLPA